MRIEDRPRRFWRRPMLRHACKRNPARAYRARRLMLRRSAQNGWSGRIGIGRIVVARRRPDRQQRARSQNDGNRERLRKWENGERARAQGCARPARHVLITRTASVARAGRHAVRCLRCRPSGMNAMGRQPMPHAHARRRKTEHCDAKAQHDRTRPSGTAPIEEPGHGSRIKVRARRRNALTLL